MASSRREPQRREYDHVFLHDVASNFIPEEARLSFEGLLLSTEAGCQRNSMFLTHSASRSNSVVWRLIQSCHVFFCAARDDRRLVVESLLCVFSSRSLLSVHVKLTAHSVMIDVSSGSRKRVSSVICMSARSIVTSVLLFLFGHDLRLLIYLLADHLLCRPTLVTLDTVVWLSG